MTELWTNALRQRLIKAGNSGVSSGAPAATRAATMSPTDALHRSTMEHVSGTQGEGKVTHDPTMGPGGGRNPADIARQKAWDAYPY